MVMRGALLQIVIGLGWAFLLALVGSAFMTEPALRRGQLTIRWALAGAPSCWFFARRLQVLFQRDAPLRLNPCRHCAPNKRRRNEFADSGFSVRVAAVAEVAGIHRLRWC